MRKLITAKLTRQDDSPSSPKKKKYVRWFNQTVNVERALGMKDRRYSFLL